MLCAPTFPLCYNFLCDHKRTLLSCVHTSHVCTCTCTLPANDKPSSWPSDPHQSDKETDSSSRTIRWRGCLGWQDKSSDMTGSRAWQEDNGRSKRVGGGSNGTKLSSTIQVESETLRKWKVLPLKLQMCPVLKLDGWLIHKMSICCLLEEPNKCWHWSIQRVCQLFSI